MSDAETVLRRTRDAATAVERLAWSIALTNVEPDPVTAAYAMRLLEAMARVEENLAPMLREATPDANYLGPLRRGMGTTAERQA